MLFKDKREKKFLILTCVLSVLQGLFYIWYGVINGFSLACILMFVFDFLYFPVVFGFRQKGLLIYLVLYSMVILYCTAFNQTELFNNFSALLCLFIAMLVFPKYKMCLMALYLVASALMFLLNDEPVYYLLIHTVRSLWLFVIYRFILYEKYNRKPVILYEEERVILEQLINNKILKEVELNGYSERTIRRKIDSAKKRNGIKTTEELKELYIKTYKQ